MKILAIDTSTLVMGVAVMEQDRVLGELVTNQKKNHSIRLMPAIDQLCTELALSMSDFGLLAVTNGPGSYTGIRIGVTTAKTLAWSIGLPLYSASSLTVLAQNAAFFPGLIVPLFDARRARVYTGVYRRLNQALVPVITQQVMPIDRLLEQLRLIDEPMLFLGEDVALYRTAISQAITANCYFGHGADNIPRPSQLGVIAWQKWLVNEAPETSDFAPDYLQLTEAEAKWLQRQEGLKAQ